MIRAFTTEPLPEGLTDRLLAAAARAPSAGFGYYDPDANPDRPALRSRRKPLADLVHRGHW